MVRAGQMGGDDPDPARQRPGLLDTGGLPVPSPRVDGVPRPGRAAVVFFAGSPEVSADLCRAVPASISARADVVVVAGVGGAPPCPAGAAVADPDGRVARAVGLPQPRDRGAPTGYAVIDGRGRLRYRTLDPTLPGAAALREVETMLGAL